MLARVRACDGACVCFQAIVVDVRIPERCSRVDITFKARVALLAPGSDGEQQFQVRRVGRTALGAQSALFQLCTPLQKDVITVLRVLCCSDIEHGWVQLQDALSRGSFQARQALLHNC